MIVDGNVITADNGMILTNGEAYSDRVYLGIHESVANWHEIPVEEVPEEEPEIDDAEVLEILLGGAV